MTRGSKKGRNVVSHTHFLYRTDMWSTDGKEMRSLKRASRRPVGDGDLSGTVITLRQDEEVIEDNRRLRTA
jgi:hypothetical protein